jgi:hypothetical protein
MALRKLIETPEAFFCELDWTCPTFAIPEAFFCEHDHPTRDLLVTEKHWFWK